MSYRSSIINLARTGSNLNTKKSKPARIKKVIAVDSRTSKEKKSKDSMQPCDELAAIFGVCAKPSFSRVKE